MRKNSRAKACNPSRIVKKVVAERDGNACIFCGVTTGLTIAHYISRAQGGLGQPFNLGTACIDCHHLMDHTDQRPEYIQAFGEYLEQLYPDTTDEDRIFKRWTDEVFSQD